MLMRGEGIRLDYSFQERSKLDPDHPKERLLVYSTSSKERHMDVVSGPRVR